MLLKIRDFATGWVAAFIVALLVIPFAFFGIDYYFSQGSEPYVAKVNDTEIKQTAFQRALSNYNQQMQNLTGSSADLDDPYIKRQTLDQLINAEVLNQTTEDSGLNIANDRILATIRQFEVFQDSEGFDADLYQRTIQSIGTPPAIFEQQVKMDMMSEQLEAAISESSFTTPKQIENLVRLKKQNRSFSYVQIPVKKLAGNITPTDDAIQTYYEDNKQQYLQDRQLKVEYLSLTVDDVANKISVSDEELENYFANNQAGYNDPEKRKFWQIKIGKPKDASAEQTTAAQKKAEELLALAKESDRFEPLAENYSSTDEDDIKVDFSETGYLAQGTSLPEVDAALFTLEQGKTSDIIETSDAYFIVHLIDIQAPKEKTFDEVRDVVNKDFRLEKAQTKYYELADQMAALSYEHPDTLEVAANAIDMPIEQSEFFTRQGIDDDPLFSSPKILSAAFANSVTQQGENSEVIEIADDHVVVLRLLDENPAVQKTLEQVRSEVTSAVVNQQAQQQAKSLGEEIVKLAKDGQDVSGLLAENGLSMEKAENINREDITVSRSVIRKAFQLPKPTDAGPVVDGNQIGNGDYIVVQLESVDYPDKLMGIDIDNQEIEMTRVRATEDWDGYFNALKANTDIQIVESNIN